MSNSPESNNGPEIKVSSVESSSERMEQLDNMAEKSAEKIQDSEKSAEKAKFDALEAAVSVESGSAEKKRQNDSASVKKPRSISKKDKEASFKKQMKDVQASQSPAEKTFSKIIHNKAVEKTSDAIGSTIARPNSILAGSVFAFILSLVVYVLAKNIGYELSGFETIGSFVLGWIIGLIYDYLRIVITGKK
jgi:hypothetical protein